MWKKTSQNSKVFVWKTFQKLKTFCNSISFFLTLILWMENWLVGSVDEVLKSLKKVSNFYTTTKQSHCYFNKINALFKAFQCTTCDTFFWKTANLEWHLVICSDRVKHVYPENVYELRKTPFENLDAFNIPYRIQQKLFKNLAILDFESICVKEDSYKQTGTTTGYREACAYISFYLLKLDPGTHFLLQRQSLLSHLVFHHRSRRINNSKQSSDETELYWSRDCNQGKTVYYTGTTQPKTQPSRERVEFCRSLFRGGGKSIIYTIPANAKKIN